MVPEPEIPVQIVQLWMCDPCLDGVGDECHTPGCSLWMHNAPRPGLRGSQGVTILGPALEPFMTRAEWRARTAAGGRAAYETWRAAVPEIVCNVPAGKWEDLPETVQAGFNAVAARVAHAADGPCPGCESLRRQCSELAGEVGALAGTLTEIRDNDHPYGSYSRVLARGALDRLHGESPQPQPAPGTEAAR
jgi:hypothetical protein